MEYVARITREGDESILQRKFRLSDRPGLDARMRELESVVDAGPHVRVLAIGELLGEGLYPDAMQAALELTRDAPDEKLPLRLALLALEGMELGGSELWKETWERWNAASHGD